MKKLHTILTTNVDKIAHFSFMYMLVDIGLNLGLSVVFLAIASFVIAVGKEIFDKIVTKQLSVIDFFATFLGGILSIIINTF